MQVPRLDQTEEERQYRALSKRVYAVFAPFYNAVTFPIRGLRRRVAHTASLSPEAIVLDVCTGTGAQAFAFARGVRKVVGADLSRAMLRVAARKRRHPRVEFCQADAAQLPFADGTFDASSVSFALHEMPRSMRAHVVCEMARVTKRGGLVVIVDYGLPQNRFAAWLAFHIVKLYEHDHYDSFIKSDPEALFKETGIDILQHEPALLGWAQIIIGRICERAALAAPLLHRTSSNIEPRTKANMA